MSQAIQGTVYEKDDKNKKQPLTGVNVYWLGTTKGTFTDNHGKYSLSREGIKDFRMIFSILGYRKDTIQVSRSAGKLDVEMSPDDQTLGEVEIRGKQDDSFVSRLNPRYTQVITTGELQRAACCNLAESFETNASVDVQYSDAISGAKQIQLLGLSGLYSQIMTENVPLIRGLATPYGLNYIPGPWMESIQVAKGSASVIQGFESITGQINVEYKKPENSEKIFLNAYGNSNQRFELNGNGAIRFNDKLSTMLLIHGDILAHKFDRNDDGFMDLPKSTNLSAMNRWDYIRPGRYISRLGIKYLYEDRNGGQMDFDKKTFVFDTNGITNKTKRYGVGIATNRLEVFWKNGFFLGPSGNTSIGLILSGIDHRQTAFYGINTYDGHEQNLYANLILTSQFHEKMHRISAGFNYSLDSYRENYLQNQLTYLYQITGDTSNGALWKLIADTVVNYNQDRNEWVAGGFMEYTLDLHEKFVMIAGARVDYDNRYGWLFTPRLHLRYQFDKTTILRGSVGKGYRTADLLAENNNVFMSQRKLYFAPGLSTQEEAWNFGINFTKGFQLFHRDAEFSLDIYQTSFVRQVIADVDSIPTAVFFYNLDGRSYAISAQAQITARPLERFAVTLAVRANDVRVTEGNKFVEKAMVNDYKGLLSLSYATRFDKWKFDLTGQLNGPARLPDTKKMPSFLQRPEYSPVWFNLLAQITKKFKHFDIYLGGENLTNFRQMDPISEYWAPYHTHFDGTMVWGPITGITIYAGVRYTLK
jgi:hypothetical protein